MLIWLVLLIDQAGLHRPNSGGSAVSGIQLAQNVLHMLFDGFDADIQRVTDLFVAQPKAM